MSVSDDDDVPVLSAHTLAALQEFYMETTKAQAGATESQDLFTVGAIQEDWVSWTRTQTQAWRGVMIHVLTGVCVCVCVHQGMSQFWYSDETATRLAEELVREAGEGGR